MAMKIKICGTARLEDAQLAAELGAWAVGLVLWPGSPRRCEEQEAERIAAALRRRTEICGVFVNPSLEEVTRTADSLGLTLVQLHGDEGPAFCAEVARRTGARVIKAKRIRDPGGLRELERFHTDFHLLDGPGVRGGTSGGEPFDWSLLARRRSKVPFLLSGGLRPENVGSALDAASRRPFALDVASGVEMAPGVKDPERMRAFFDAVAAQEHAETLA
jgi:phosphoribosylanthranilate isomerase